MSDVETNEPGRGRGLGSTDVLPLPRQTSRKASALASVIASPWQGSASGAVPMGVAPRPSQVCFDHRELRAILDLYARMVARGEWRDYAIDFLKDKAVFSIFRRTADVPLYRIEKDPKSARRQGIYAVVAATGLVLKRGHELPRVLHVLDKPFRLVAE